MADTFRSGRNEAVTGMLDRSTGGTGIVSEIVGGVKRKANFAVVRIGALAVQWWGGGNRRQTTLCGFGWRLCG